MRTTATSRRTRKERHLYGVPMVATHFAEAPTDRERVAAWWQTMGRFALMSLSIGALMGCGPGTSEARCKTTGAWLAQNEGGPVIVIARACKPGGDE